MKKGILIIFIFSLAIIDSWANNLEITNVALSNQNTIDKTYDITLTSAGITHGVLKGLPATTMPLGYL